MRRQKMTGRSQQRGVALIVALLILVLISILGVSALRTSIFNSKISVGAQVGTMTFQAAESAIAAVYDEAMSDITQPGHVLGNALTQKSSGLIQIQDRCVTRDDVRKPSLCSASDFLDSRDLLRAESSTIVRNGVSGLAGFEIGSWGQYEFVTVGRGEMPTFNTDNVNVQEFSRIAPMIGAEF
jgi:type IV pilus assembly protein PilX